MLHLVWLVPTLPLLGVVINGIFGRWTRERAHYLGVGSTGASLLIALGILVQAAGGATLNWDAYVWIPAGEFQATVGFLVDPLSAVMMFVVTFVGFLIHVYSVGYMHGDPGYPRFFTYLNLFMTSMLFLVLANNYLLMFLGWEGVGLCSYLLIGFWYEKKSASDAGKKAFVVNRIGDAGFLLGIFLIWRTFGSVAYAEVFPKVQHFSEVLQKESVFGLTLVTWMTLLLFVGATGKSAQLPLYVWLPDAMEGPTPVSALIHAATMVTAGVYMVARSAALFNVAPISMGTVAWVGGLTAVFAATIALVQTDIKRVVAYSTISQLGYMFLGCGVGAYAAAIFHLMTHAFFKALLFLGAGSVIHGMGGEQDLRKMGGLRKHMPITAWTFLLAALANAGIFPLAGFWSKDEILYGAFAAGRLAVWALGATGALLTGFYMLRCYYLAFEGRARTAHLDAHDPHESPRVMTVPLVILAAFAAVIGFVGVPPEHGVYHRFVGPVFASAAGPPAHAAPVGELWMAILSLAIAASGVWLATRCYIWRPGEPDRWAARFPAVYRLLLNKYYVDELYDALFVEPVRRAAIWLWRWFDDPVVDGSVNGIGVLVQASSRLLRYAQTGYVMSYVLSFLVGVVFVLGYLVWR
jgi:NADH-quinone oxidoreductase subunit L